MKSLRQLVPHRYWILGLSLLAIPTLVILFRGWNGFAYPSETAPYSDLTLSHYTFIAFIKQQIVEQAVFPLWFPSILSGTPLIANPLAGLWYPFGWPAFVLPLPFAFNLLVGLHLSWGALGMYLLLRQQRLGIAASLFGGLAFGLMPKLFAHYGAGHLTLIYALPWTPWLLLSTKLDNKYRPIFSAMILGIIFLADIRWAVYAGLLWLAWLLVQPYQKTDDGTQTLENGGAFRAGLRAKFRYIAILILLASLLTACLSAPLVENTRLSTRADLTNAENLEYSLPWAGLLGIFYPPLRGGAHESLIYFGSIVLMLALLALFQIRENRQVQFWFILALGALIFSLGSNLPFLQLVSHLPVINLLRVPTRALFIFGMALAVLAALSIDNVALLQKTKNQRRANLWISALFVFVALISILILVLSNIENNTPIIWGLIAALASALILWSWVNKRINHRLLIIAVFGLLLLDAGLAGQSMLAYRSKEAVWKDDEPLALFLAKDPDQFRTYSPSFSLLQHVAASYDLELTDGVDPLQLKNYVEFMKSATGIPWEGYRVIVPGIGPGEPDVSSYTPDPKKLGLLNVKYILAEFDLPPSNELALVEQIGETRIYENLQVKPRAWSIVGEPGAEPTEYPIGRLTWSPNRITINARGPGQLVLSEISYPGWQATVDGEAAEIHTAAGILRSVDLHDQQQQVEFVFRPMSFYVGFTISVITWLGLLIFLLRSRKSRLQTPVY